MESCLPSGIMQTFSSLLWEASSRVKVLCWKLCTCVKLRKLIGVVPTALLVGRPVHLCDETKYSRGIMSWSLLTSLLPSKWNIFILLPFSSSRHMLYGFFICLLSTQSVSKELPVTVMSMNVYLYSHILLTKKSMFANACDKSASGT